MNYDSKPQVSQQLLKMIVVAWYTVNLYLDSSSAIVSEDLNFKSLHLNQIFGSFLVAFSISLLICDPVMSFSVNYIDTNTTSTLYRSQQPLCTKYNSSEFLFTCVPLRMSTESVSCCLKLDWGDSDHWTDGFEK